VAARLAPAFFRDRIIDRMLEPLPPGELRERVRREMAASDAATVMQAARAVIRFASHDWVSTIDVPTAVVVMTRDRLVPTARQYKLAAAIPGAKVFEVDGDHLACVRAADRFVPVLEAACDWAVAAGASGRRPVTATALSPPPAPRSSRP
jgi:pimeloyl-ACP methyl ester carboxylesterase